MSVLGEFLKGIVSVMTVLPSPLYRYPYRNSAEAFRGDWGRIGKDISFVFEQPEKEDGGNER